ncbi:hypothetical protein BpHYR1_044739 [Brachionus plicatilis]|uniref:Uncharacterized protein n=1 Tax=Brachionus plicatilis TaxID=10195 RepID=A0A3M7Q6Y4_BRAPC|nr:hypothetical protein BpHYR1_044739 [Brachionus plicatilis]
MCRSLIHFRVSFKDFLLTIYTDVLIFAFYSNSYKIKVLSNGYMFWGNYVNVNKGAKNLF